MSDVRLIDANALKSLLIEVMERIKENPKMAIDEMHIIAGCHMLCEMIDDATTIDAVPVVRCRECKHHRKGACPMRSLHVATRGYGIQDNTVDDGFCHMGAKMDGGAD